MGDSTGWSSSDRIIVTHAALGGLLGMVVWPSLAVIGRYLRTFYPRWVRVHYIIAGGIAIPMLIVVFALGRAHVGDEGNWSNTHFRLGLVLLLLGIIQAIYGSLVHGIGPPTFPNTGLKSALRYVHPVSGLTIVVLGFVQVYTGFGQWGKPGEIPSGVVPAWAVLLAVWMAIYLAGFYLLPRQWKAIKAKENEGYGPDGEKVGGKGRSSAVGLTTPSPAEADTPMRAA